MSSSQYDVIVVGAGSMGSAAAYYLAAGGAKVLVFEQFSETPHDHGSHAGQSRIIRKAYFEGPAYVPLMQRAYSNWEDLENLSGEKIFYRSGLLYYGPAGHEVIRGVKQASKDFEIPIEEITVGDQKERFPYRSFQHQNAMLLEPDAGFLLPGRAIRSFLDLAVKKNAVLKTGEKVLSWGSSASGVKVFTDKDTYSADKLIFTAGAWTNKLLKGILPLRITRQVIIWVEMKQPKEFDHEHFPCWMIAGDEFKGVYYGFPYLSGEKFPGHQGLKFAWHHAALDTDPDEVDRLVTEEELHDIVKRVAYYFPAVDSKIHAHQTCLYTNTPDEDFIIDHLPGTNERVIIASPCSGHGFKFASAIGEVLSDLALKGRSDLDLRPFAFR